MPTDSINLVLGSASPRRKTLLQEAGLRFQVLPADVDESFDPDQLAVQAACELAEKKALAAAGLAALRGPSVQQWVIGGDTLVVLGPDPDPCPGGTPPTYLGKPRDEQEARAMLSKLSGTTHRVVTGVAVATQAPDGATKIESAAEVTFVTMRIISEDEQRAYVASGEWRGKAGGYAIQESADQFVDKLEGGGFDNVVGLPVELTLDLLAKAGWSQ